jgi:ankyrin repeat protein
MKHLLIKAIAAVVLVGCGSAEIDRTLIAAIAKDDIEVVKQHIAAGADVNVKNKVGGTPLHFAAFEVRKEIVELLITKGAQVNVKSKDGLTPLDRAIKYKHNETANLLRKNGGKTGEELKAEGK